MSSRRKSTTPCMVLPSNAVEQVEEEEEEEEERMDVTGEAGMEEAGRKKSGEEDIREEGAAVEEEMRETMVVVAPPPLDSDEPAFPPVEDCREPLASLKPGPAQHSLEGVLCGDGESAVFKTPIMRMKSKAEPKRIAVSLKSREEDAPAEMLLQDSMRFGGGMLVNPPTSEQQRKKSSALSSSVLPAGLAQVLSALQAQQSSAAAAAAAAVIQPQLLVPLTSIPSYSAAMDTNPLLGNTYKKFPYPSMAEIASLAAQTQFTEEHIKVWFSAQRLKHGVSWTPEEVEEARRKQFNGTVHTVPQTITVIPAHHLSAAANGLQSILQTCQIVGQHGLLFTQVGPGGNLPVTSPITLTVAGMPNLSQSAKGFSCQPSPGNSELKKATTIQPPSLSPQENSALSCDTFGMRPKKSKEQLAELKASYTKNQFASDAEIARLMRLTNLTKGEIKKWFSDTRYNQRNSKSSHVIVFHEGGIVGRAAGGGSTGSGAPIVIDSSDEPTSPQPPPSTPPAREGGREPRTPKTWNPFPDFTLQKFKEKTPEQLVLLEESFEKSGTPADEELSRLRTETKLTRREVDAWFTERRKTPPGSQTPPGGRGGQPQDSRDKTKKSPEQLHILKSAFVRTQWPATEEYDRLAEESGLPRSYIRRVRNRGWGRSRTRKQPKRSASELDRSPPLVKFKSGRDILKEYYLRHRFLNELDLDELVSKSNMSYEQVREWFAEVHRRVDTGLDPFEDHGEATGKATEGKEGSLVDPAMDTGGATAAATGDEVDDEDEDDEEEDEDEDESDESEVWQPSRSVRKSLSGAED
ncbi:hypothetical protein NHX12_001850 [Muraenolepis orangiensis]|uniref:Zinc fingers and homeoboxes protein 1 n=1 Tax=Muraenolepis orangiensis TaxID=630683 RepID=A0A9Q0DZA4_9TELE|nr:hypothetical protein NHX12_001850 [Muraenolepis orangiensis]